MRAYEWPTPTRIIGELLTSHLEAESLLAEAGHRQALAAWSAADTGTRFRRAQAARRAYEELWHRLEPRRGRPVPFDVGLVLAVAGGGLVMLDFVELSGVLVAGAAALIACMEPAVLLAARRRWRRARVSYEEAVRVWQADLEAAAVGTEAWLGLVRAWVTTVARGEEQLIGETVALAVALAKTGRPKLPAADKERLDPVAMSRKTTRADPRQGVLPIDADLRQYCLRNLPSSELQIPLLLCHPPVAIRWAASRILAAGR